MLRVGFRLFLLVILIVSVALLRSILITNDVQPLLFVGSETNIKPKSRAFEIARDISSKYTGRVPKLIHQIYVPFNPSQKSLPHFVQISISSFKKQNPTWKHILWNADDIDDLISLFFPAFNRTYQNIPLEIMKIDVVKYIILYLFGGVYADVDVTGLKPIEQWTLNWQPHEARAVIGIEADSIGQKNWWKSFARPLQFCQWTFMSTPGHPLFASALYKSIDRLMELEEVGSLAENWKRQVVNTTGPGVFTDAALEYLLSKGVESVDLTKLRDAKLVGDVVVLPLTGFAPGSGRPGAEGLNHPLAMVLHSFKGSWKEKPVPRIQGSRGEKQGAEGERQLKGERTRVLKRTDFDGGEHERGMERTGVKRLREETEAIEGRRRESERRRRVGKEERREEGKKNSEGREGRDDERERGGEEPKKQKLEERNIKKLDRNNKSPKPKYAHPKSKGARRNNKIQAAQRAQRLMRGGEGGEDGKRQEQLKVEKPLNLTPRILQMSQEENDEAEADRRKMDDEWKQAVLQRDVRAWRH